MRMLFYVIDRTAPVDTDIRGTPEARQGRLQALEVGQRVNRLVGEVHERLVRDVDLVRLAEVIFDFLLALFVGR